MPKSKYLLPIALLGNALLSATVSAVEPTVHCDGHEALLERFVAFTQVIQMDRDETKLEEFYSPNYLSHTSDITSPGRHVSIEMLTRLLVRSKEKHPERTIRPIKIVCANEFVIVHAHVSEDFNSPMAGIEPTGEPFQTTATNIYRFEDGKVAERWGNADTAYVYKQLGFKVIRE